MHIYINLGAHKKQTSGLWLQGKIFSKQLDKNQVIPRLGGLSPSPCISLSKYDKLTALVVLDVAGS